MIGLNPIFTGRIMDTLNPKADSSVSHEIADLDARMSAKESFATRIGLLPFATGAIAALISLVAMQVITHL
ncbi:Uncharacterized protein ALO75_00249 [Pseudomonas syringae pv. coryli]|uniref:Uncharacterized protein n=6 Tax=Pseudomonas syringae group TaxID=136849 RepID=A0A0P9NF73_9PSED|nr:Uncharacterized protein ALO75_00249 [Pseudomonas syringae pv. coryli]KPY67640.1 Uncharacterized protein ALO45_02647 [Pseudomonas syringae pv. syringae]RMM25703.1 hypothetical protein ALQ82_04314 [Pseudomonas syringae pv. pisi]RMU68800.1 hypothetical protein ALP24_03762 [Pseudomonas syringae pv. aptata]RMU91175.1 hypothetical protein ALP21_03961 [Pseudomonas savastanoi pv. phaseolicola]